MSQTKDVRCKIDEEIWNEMKKVAEKGGGFIGTLAKDIIEDFYKKNGSGYFFKLKPEHLAIIKNGSQEIKVEANEYLSVLLDKVLPNDTMHAVTFNVPKGATEQEILEWFRPRVSSLAKKLGDKIV